MYRVGLKTQEQLQSFLTYADQNALDIWRDPSVLPGSSVRDADIMVPPAKRIDFINKMKSIGATVATFIPDVQRLVAKVYSCLTNTDFFFRKSSYLTLRNLC